MSDCLPAPEHVVVLAPIGADAANISAVLGRGQVQCVIASDMADLVVQLEAGAGALLVAEEAFAEGAPGLAAAIERQPLWSDLPVLVLASAGSIARWAAESPAILGARSNVSLIGRPLQGATLVAAVHTLLRTRRRQYEIRDLLREREALLGSLEQRVQERTAKLQELVAELEAFSYTVSHDLRAPLRVMASYAQIVLDDYDATLVPEVRHYVERIARAAGRMDSLTEDVLAYTRLARGEMTTEPVDLKAVIQETVEQYPDLAALRRVITWQEPLAPVIAHRPSLIQVLSNLLGNAVKFARADEPLQIVISTERRGDRVIIRVQDNGVGIHPDHHEKIFRIFERVASQAVPGTGIGLAIVKKAAERMGGRVGVVSHLGEGATFWMELAAAGAPETRPK